MAHTWARGRSNAIVIAMAMLSLIGCAGSDAVEGAGIPDEDPATMRRAALEVTETPEPPPGAKMLGKVSASRGHRNFTRAEPTENEIKLELKCAAFAVGADGISNVKIAKKSGLMNNYWWVLEGSAQAWKR